MTFKHQLENCAVAEGMPAIKKQFLEYQTDNFIPDADMIDIYNKAKYLHQYGIPNFNISNVPDLLTSLEVTFKKIGVADLPEDAYERMLVLSEAAIQVNGEGNALLTKNSPSSHLINKLTGYGRGCLWVYKTYDPSKHGGDYTSNIGPALTNLVKCVNAKIYDWKEIVDTLSHSAVQLYYDDQKAGWAYHYSPTEIAGIMSIAIKQEKERRSSKQKRGIFGKKESKYEPKECLDMFYEFLPNYVAKEKY